MSSVFIYVCISVYVKVRSGSVWEGSSLSEWLMFTRNPNNVSRSSYATEIQTMFTRNPNNVHQKSKQCFPFILCNSTPVCHHNDEHDFDPDEDLDKSDDVATVTDEVAIQSDVVVWSLDGGGHQGCPSKPHEQGFQIMSSSSETSSCHHKMITFFPFSHIFPFSDRYKNISLCIRFVVGFRPKELWNEWSRIRIPDDDWE